MPRPGTVVGFIALIPAGPLSVLTVDTAADLILLASVGPGGEFNT